VYNNRATDQTFPIEKTIFVFNKCLLIEISSDLPSKIVGMSKGATIGLSLNEWMQFRMFSIQTCTPAPDKHQKYVKFCLSNVPS
jgi:hypothetical protein